jgi:hypothetical protein
MLRFFLLFVIYIVHIHFLLKNIFFDIDEAKFFMFTAKYGFDKNTAILSLIYTILCISFFLFGFSLIYKKKKTIPLYQHRFRGIKYELIIMNTLFFFLVIYILYAGISTKFNYGLMSQFRERTNFLFELRMIPLIFFSHITLNTPIKVLLKDDYFKGTRFIMIIYIISLLTFQVRSPLFELFFILFFSHLMWTGDKFKFKYLILLLLALIIPNIVILGRIGIPEDRDLLMDGLFSIEYSMMLNKFLGTAMVYRDTLNDGLSFLPQVTLIIPSPIRNLFGITADNNQFFLNVSDYAGIHGGGFSLLAQTYIDFGWYSFILFFVLGFFIGKMINGASKVGNVSLVYSVAPMIFGLFLLTLRNDLGVFIKYSIQSIFIAAFLRIFINTLLNVKNNES